MRSRNAKSGTPEARNKMNLSKVSLRKLMESFEDTAIYDEALKELFRTDLDLDQLISLLAGVRDGSVKVIKLENAGKASPVAQAGLEKVSMKTDLIPPERMKHLLLESAKARLLSEVRTFICTKCWEYLEMIRLSDLPDHPACPKCGSLSLGVLRTSESEVQSIIDKKGEDLSKTEQQLRRRAQNTGRLVSKYGKPAAVSLSGRNLKIIDVKEVLEAESMLSDRFFEIISEAEKKSLKRKFW